MADKNKNFQADFFSGVFNVTHIDYDDFLLPPDDYRKERYLSAFQPKAGWKVLELGIGISSFHYRFSQKYKVTSFALDYVYSSLIAQKQNAPGTVRVFQGDGETLPCKDLSVDMVIALSTIEHFSDYPKAFQEIFRVLKPGGKCLVHMPCRDFAFSRFARFRTCDKLAGQTRG
jgi:ubiquinone/menaquinone biosynthesis C-methylase UbiE